MLPVIVNAIRAKDATDAHSPYEFMFCTLHRWLISVPDKFLSWDDSSFEDDPQRRARKDKFIKVLFMQSIRMKRCSNNLSARTKPF